MMSTAQGKTPDKIGLLWCMGSVLLVTFSQLLLKWAVLCLPALLVSSLVHVVMNFSSVNLQNVLLLAWDEPLLLLLLTAGLLGYVLSMFCWFFALRRLPLSYAYPMLSLSYVLVYLLAACIPWFGEPVTLLKSAGVALILFGVWLIHGARQPA